MSVNLGDGSIVLRAPRPGDAAAAIDAVRASLDELTLWTSWCHADYGLDDVATFLRKVEADRFEDRAYDFYILDEGQTKVLGGCGLYHIDRTVASASLGYWVRSDAARRGIATNAGRALVEFGFRELELARIEILAAAENDASQRVAEKLGAVREGLLRNRLRSRGQLVDAVCFSLIPTDVHVPAPS